MLICLSRKPEVLHHQAISINTFLTIWFDLYTNIPMKDSRIFVQRSDSIYFVIDHELVVQAAAR